MIKKVRVEQLKPGMYIHDLNCDWMEHTFVRSRFKLTHAKDLEKIRKMGIRDLYIDTTKGLDVADAPTEPEIRARLDRGLERTAADFNPDDQTVALDDERDRAQRIHFEANQVVSGLLGDVRLGKQIEVERVNPVVERMVGSIFRNQDALLGLTRIRRMDRYTFEHSVSVAVLMISFARALSMKRPLIQEIATGALLHDVGKIMTPPEILNKPGKLTEPEFEVMRQHVVHSRDILEKAPGFSKVALAVAAEHHERLDGSGYPLGLKGEAISRYGQMASIVDVYDAITADRVYHKGMEPHSVLRKLLEWSDHHFNPSLVQRFIQCVGIYPVGTVVRLHSGRIGVVVETGQGGPLKPVVRLLLDVKNKRHLTPRDLDLGDQHGGHDRIVASELPERWKIDPRIHLQQSL